MARHSRPNYPGWASRSIRAGQCLPLLLRLWWQKGLDTPDPHSQRCLGSPGVLPACMRTFMVSMGWMVDCDAALATAPATTSVAGLSLEAGAALTAPSALPCLAGACEAQAPMRQLAAFKLGHKVRS